MKKTATASDSAEAGRRWRPFDRALHGIYKFTGSFYNSLGRRCRPPGIALALTLVISTFLAAADDKAAVHQLFSLSLGMFVIGIGWSLCRRASVEARRDLPRFATAGEPMSYTVRIWNRGQRHLKRAWLSDTPPNPAPSLEDFLLLREPGEEERNGFDRSLAYFRWRYLRLRNRLFTDGNSKADFHLQKDQSTEVAMQIVPLRRGVIRFDDLRILLPDPFGLFQRSKRVKAVGATLTVLPKRYPLPAIELPGGAAYKVSGEANTNAIGNSGEFVGLRDYRPGDPLRQIHWKSWARTGRPIVKELEDTHYPRYGLLVDTLSVARTDHRFEEVISVAASFAASIDTGESLLDLMFIKNEAHIVTAGRGVERTEKLLEVLAAVTPERTQSYDDLARLVAKHKDDLNACILILNGWDDARAELLETIRFHGILCSAIIVGDGPAPAAPPGHWLESGQVARDLMRLPHQLSAAN